MMGNPLLLGVLLLTMGGLAGGSFYVPFGKVKAWAWETYWLTMGVVAWATVPLLVAWITVPNLLQVFLDSPLQSIAWAYLFGAMWGVGAVTFGLTMRYLGISLGMAIVVGLVAAFGTLVPPIVDGQFGDLLVTASGLTVLAGVAVCVAGIGICGYSGMRKERELTEEQKKATIAEFALIKGFVVAIVCGLMSASIVYGINAGKPIAQVAVGLGTPSVYQNNPTFVVVLAGGFTVNSAYCLVLSLRNRSIHEYVTRRGAILLANYALVLLAGVLWYGQLFFYGMGTTKMGEYGFAAWSIQTALVIVFSNLWGIALKEWKGVSPRTLLFLSGGILVLVLSVTIIGAGSYLATTEK